MNRNVRVRTKFYQQFDADVSLPVPAEGYGGWQTADIPLSLDHTALVVMHAWDCGTPQEFPGWYRAVEYIPRAEAIARDVLPPLLAGVRAARVKVYHVVGEGSITGNAPVTSASWRWAARRLSRRPRWKRTKYTSN